MEHNSEFASENSRTKFLLNNKQNIIKTEKEYMTLLNDLYNKKLYRRRY